MNHDRPIDKAQVYATAGEVISFTSALFMAYDVSSNDADITARCLVRADLRGVESHGITRMTGYLDRLERGLVNAKPNLRVEQVTAAAARLDGDDGLGFVVATRAIDESVRMAADVGIGIVGVHRSTHFGMAANYVLQAVDAGYVALVFTNASRAMPPWGGREALLGTSPIAAGAPSGSEHPFVLDMSPAVAARGKIRRALKLGRPIPAGYALDAQGRETTDPAAALAGGVVLPVAGPKGSGLALLMDVLGGVLTGAAFGGDVGDQYKDYDRPQNVGHTFLAVRPDLFVGDFEDRMSTLMARVTGIDPAEGFDEILTPGEPEQRTEEHRLRTGIPYVAADLHPLHDLAEKAGVRPLPTSPAPLST